MKKLFILFMTAIMLTSLTACVGPMNRGVSGSRPEGTTTLETLEETNKDSSVVSSATALALAQTVSVADVCEFYVDYTNITKDVMPPTPGSFYSHYEAEDGKVYVGETIENWSVRQKAIEMLDKYYGVSSDFEHSA